MVAEKMASLLPVGAEERFVEAKRVWDRIEAISAETAEFIRAMDNLDNTSNCSSVLSDPFSDMGESEFVKARSNKRLSKLESDILLMSSFTPEFMAVQEQFIAENAEMKTPIYSEPLGKKSYDYLIDMPRDEDDQIKTMVEEMLASCGVRSQSPGTAVPAVGNAQKSRDTPSALGRSPMSEANDTNSLSEVWRLLEAGSTSNGFPVSPIGYNIFEDSRLEWLRREPRNWNESEVARQKCEDWLQRI